MDQRTEYLIQILDKIGAPLIAGLSHGQRQGGPEENAKSEAQTIAELLSRSVQMSIQIGKIMELDMTDPAAGDRFRLALMSLAGPIVADQYAQDGHIPGENEQAKILTALEAILTFSDNFTASPENTQQLADQDDKPGGDSSAAALYSLRYFTPVINAIATFPFGQPEKKLMQDVTSKITAQAKNLADIVLPDADAGQKSRGELALIQALGKIYSDCHMGEMNRMMNAGDDAGPGGGMDNVWQAFEIRAAMLETLAANLLPGDAPASQPQAPVPDVPVQEASVPPASPPEPPASGGPAVPSIFSKKPEAEAPPAEQAPSPPDSPGTPETPPAASAPPPSGGGYNPMSSFAKKPAEGDSAPAETPPPPPPAASAPPSSPPLGESQPPASDNPSDEQKDGDKGGDNGGSPMSFFKKDNN